MYEARVENSTLGVSKLVKGTVHDEVVQRAREQLARWDAQVAKRRDQQSKQRDQEDCSALAEEARLHHEGLQGILASTLAIDDKIDWDARLDHSTFPPLNLDEPAPRRAVDPFPPSPSPKGMWEWLIPSRKRQREERDRLERDFFQRSCEENQSAYEKAILAWQARRELAEAHHARDKERFLASQTANNNAVALCRSLFETGDPDVVVDYILEVFEASEYPPTFQPQHNVVFRPETNSVVIDLGLPPIAEVSDVIDYQFVARSREAKPVRLKKKDHDALYDGAVKQTVLRTIHEVIESVYTTHVMQVVVNGWVTYVDPATGIDQTSCIISVSASREEFEAINLARVDPTECIRKLKGLIAGPLAQMAPVKPILQLNRQDRRFVESHDVLAEINSTTNLAEIPWEEFEHLVRELFAKMFTEAGADVRVTQASRDGGVDAVIFDPDPIRGGKFVVQAKRYINVVPVSAVRDLYGTVQHERAAKGILVTTAFYGRDSHEFAKDKPLTLIDGSNLVYLLEQHGHKVRIDVEEARANRA